MTLEQYELYDDVEDDEEDDDDEDNEDGYGLTISRMPLPDDGPDSD